MASDHETKRIEREEETYLSFEPFLPLASRAKTCRRGLMEEGKEGRIPLDRQKIIIVWRRLIGERATRSFMQSKERMSNGIEQRKRRRKGMGRYTYPRFADIIVGTDQAGRLT